MRTKVIGLVAALAGFGVAAVVPVVNSALASPTDPGTVTCTNPPGVGGGSYYYCGTYGSGTTTTGTTGTKTGTTATGTVTTANGGVRYKKISRTVHFKDRGHLTLAWFTVPHGAKVQVLTFAPLGGETFVTNAAKVRSLFKVGTAKSKSAKYGADSYSLSASHGELVLHLKRSGTYFEVSISSAIVSLDQSTTAKLRREHRKFVAAPILLVTSSTGHYAVSIPLKAL